MIENFYAIFAERPTITYDDSLKSTQTYKVNSILKLPVVVEGVPRPKVSWFHDDIAVEPGKRHTVDVVDKANALAVRECKREDGGIYLVTAENDAGKASADFEVLVRGM